MRGSEFAELKAFVAVVDRANFARAADHLGLSRSALSQIIRKLETRLDVRLLNRTTRSVAPTEAGRRLHERIAPLLREMDDAVAQAVGATARAAGTLRINASSMAAKKVIAPRLGRFHSMYPDVVLDVVIDDGLSDIVSGEFDAGIRVGARLEKDMVAVRLTPDIQLLAVASPAYLKEHGEPHTPSDLQHHACINWRFPGSGRIAAWAFESKGDKMDIMVEGPVISNHQDIVVPAALQGLGIFYAYNDSDIADAIEDGRLKRILKDWSPTVPGLYLYYTNRRYLRPALRAFIDCLRDRDDIKNEVGN